MDYNGFELLNIKGDCFDMLVASYSNWLKREYRYLFVDCIGFSFVMSRETIGEKLHLGGSDIVKIANKNGLLINIYNSATYKTTWGRNDYYNQLPFVVVLDEYDCVWRAYYKKLHRNHFLIITDIDEKSHNIMAMDTMPTKSGVCLSFDVITTLSKKIISFTNNKQVNIKKDIGYPPMISFIRKDIFGDIWERFDIFLNILFIQEELEKELNKYATVSIFDIPLVWNLKCLQYSFEHYLEYLTFLNDPQYKGIDECIMRIVNKIQIANNCLILSIIKKNHAKSLNRYRELFMEAVECMKKLVDILK